MARIPLLWRFREQVMAKLVPPRSKMAIVVGSTTAGLSLVLWHAFVAVSQTPDRMIASKTARFTKYTIMKCVCETINPRASAHASHPNSYNSKLRLKKNSKARMVILILTRNEIASSYIDPRWLVW